MVDHFLKNFGLKIKDSSSVRHRLTSAEMFSKDALFNLRLARATSNTSLPCLMLFVSCSYEIC